MKDNMKSIWQTKRNREKLKELNTVNSSNMTSVNISCGFKQIFIKDEFQVAY